MFVDAKNHKITVTSETGHKREITLQPHLFDILAVLMIYGAVRENRIEINIENLSYHLPLKPTLETLLRYLWTLPNEYSVPVMFEMDSTNKIKKVYFVILNTPSDLDINAIEINLYLRRRKQQHSHSLTGPSKIFSDNLNDKIARISDFLLFGNLPKAENILSDPVLSPAFVLQKLNPSLRPKYLSVLYHRRANFYMQHGEPLKALAEIQRAERYYCALNNPLEIAGLETIKCAALRMIGKFSEAINATQKALYIINKTTNIETQEIRHRRCEVLSSTLAPVLQLREKKAAWLQIENSLELAVSTGNLMRETESWFRVAHLNRIDNNKNKTLKALEHTSMLIEKNPSAIWLKGWLPRYWAEYFIAFEQDREKITQKIEEAWWINLKSATNFQLYLLIKLLVESPKAWLQEEISKGFRMSLEWLHYRLYNHFHRNCCPDRYSPLYDLLNCIYHGFKRFRGLV